MSPAFRFASAKAPSPSPAQAVVERLLAGYDLHDYLGLELRRVRSSRWHANLASCAFRHVVCGFTFERQFRVQFWPATLPYHYQYCLNISYNEEGTPGMGSAIFLHCLAPAKPFTGGCVSIPEDHMKYVMAKVDENTVIVIDTYENLSGGEDWPDSTWPQER